MMTMLMVEFAEGTTAGEIRDLAELIRDHACVRGVHGYTQQLMLTNSRPARAPVTQEFLRNPLTDLGLPARTVNALKAQHIHNLVELTRLTATELLDLPGVGGRAFKDVENLLTKHGLKLCGE